MSCVCRTCVGSGVWLRLGCASERKVNEPSRFLGDLSFSWTSMFIFKDKQGWNAGNDGMELVRSPWKDHATSSGHLHKLRCVCVCVSEIYQNYLIT